MKLYQQRQFNNSSIFEKMDSTQTIMIYKAILAITGKMLIAAQNKEWDELVSLEQECGKLAQILINENHQPILDTELLQNKIKIIHQILDDDAQIRAITESWMIRLQDILCANGKVRSLQRAYLTTENT